jgi:hypothetical protein
MESILSSAKPLIYIVRLANALCVKNQIGRSGDCSDGEITDDMLAPLKLTRDKIPEIEKKIFEEMEKAGGFLDAWR